MANNPAARLTNQLEEEQRETLTIASVEGEDFTAQVIARVQEIPERRLMRDLSQELEKRHRLVRERGEERVGRRGIVPAFHLHAAPCELLAVQTWPTAEIQHAVAGRQTGHSDQLVDDALPLLRTAAGQIVALKMTGQHAP